MKTFVTALRKELFEQWRSKRLVVVAVVLLVFGMLSPVMARFMPEFMRLIPGAEAFAALVPTPTILDAVTQYIKNTNQFGILLALLMAMGAVAIEKDKGTAAMMLVKPLPRSTFIVAKFLALAITFLVSLVLAGLAGYYYTVFLFGAADFGAWMAMNLLMWVSLLVYVAVVLLFSTLFKSQAAAAGLGFGFLILLSAVGAVPSLSTYQPGQLVTWGAMLLTSSQATYWPALWISLGIIAISLAAACLVFERQEL